MTKNTKNILSITVILALITSCSTTKEIPNLDEATFTAMRYENGLAGKKKQLLRAGIAPIDTEDSREMDKYDNMYMSFKDKLALTEYMIDKVGKSVLITIPRHSIMTTDFKVDDKGGYLKMLISALKEYKKTYIEITGHTGRIGNVSTNERISKIRARTFAEYLAMHDIAPERMFINGLGAARRIADDTTPTGNALNNRIEIKISPIY